MAELESHIAPYNTTVYPGVESVNKWN